VVAAVIVVVVLIFHQRGGGLEEVGRLGGEELQQQGEGSFEHVKMG